MYRVDTDGSRALATLRWGLVPSWAKDLRRGARLVNARAETVHDTPSFSAAFRARRCLVPANGWFEWQRTGHAKQPYFFPLVQNIGQARVTFGPRCSTGVRRGQDHTAR